MLNRIKTEFRAFWEECVVWPRTKELRRAEYVYRERRRIKRLPPPPQGCSQCPMGRMKVVGIVANGWADPPGGGWVGSPQQRYERLRIWVVNHWIICWALAIAEALLWIYRGIVWSGIVRTIW